MACYREALRYQPAFPEAHFFMGDALDEQGKMDEAIAHYNAALKLNPDSAVAQNNPARIYHTQGRFAEATNILQTAQRLAGGDRNLDLSNECAAMLQRFQQSQPWREQ